MARAKDSNQQRSSFGRSAVGALEIGHTVETANLLLTRIKEQLATLVNVYKNVGMPEHQCNVERVISELEEL